MTTSSNTETNSGPKMMSPEWIDQAVSDTIDELLAEISLKLKLHPSEQQNRDVFLVNHPITKIYDFINSYHAYCKLCEQHFYSRSVPSDINSFFQNHVNTSYHQQMRTINLPPDDVPMFEWEKKFHSGRCKVCDMEGLNSFILDTKFDSKKLIKLHVCIWDLENRERNEKTLRKLNLLKIYCGLKIFQKKYLKSINGRMACLLCGVKLSWTDENARCHLTSNAHYKNFCVFVKSHFQLSPKDVLNGFHLELITRWLICNDPPTPVADFPECDEREMCFRDSNRDESPYFDNKDNFSCTPKLVERLLENDDSDFIDNNECLLCNVVFSPEHANSEFHRTKAENLNEDCFDTSEKYLAFCRNREKRLHIIENYKRLESGFEEPVKRQTPDSSVKQPKRSRPPQFHYFKALLRKKAELVGYTFTVSSSGQIFCQVCDQYLPISNKALHLTTLYHKIQSERWNELMEHVSNDQFVEPFHKIKKVIICLLCGAIVNPNNFFSHLKAAAHIQKFVWYCKLNISIPISSAVVLRGDLSCFCNACNTLLSQRVSFSSLKTVLKKIKCHWPCPSLKENKAGLSDEPKVATEVQNAVVEETQTVSCDVFQDAPFPCSSCEKPFTENKTMTNQEKVGLPNKEVDFEKVGNAVENILNVFEKKIIDDALDKSVYLISSLNNSKSVSGSKKQKNSQANDLPPDKVGSSRECAQTNLVLSTTKPSIKNENKDETGEKTVMNLKAPKTVNNTENHDKKEPPVVRIKERERNGKNQEASMPAEKLPALNKDLIFLFQHPQILMDFVMNLIMQAISGLKSQEEMKREEFVCSTIIGAISKCYPLGRCYPFGSRLSGLTLNNSDLDVFLDCGGMYDGFKCTTPCAERKLVNNVAKLLRKKPEIAEIVVVDRARVPIVSFLHRPTLMRCDLSFKNGLSIRNTLLIKFMLSLDWRVRPLILVLKHWAKLNGLHGPPHFSSYAIAMLVIFYLQQLTNPVLPTIESLQNNFVGRRITIGGWDCSFNLNISNLPETTNKEPFPQLLAGFFEFYSNFDYSTNIISPLSGKPLPRKAFSGTGSKLPMCYKRHALNLPMPIDNLVNNKIFICIIDPFDLSHVLTKSITSRGLQEFTHLCQISEKYLKEAQSISTLSKKKKQNFYYN